jgi:signal transduction histidine kinase
MDDADPADGLKAPGELTDLEILANLVQSLFGENNQEIIVQKFLNILPSVLPVSFCTVSLRPRHPGAYWWAAGRHDGQSLSARLLDKIADHAQHRLANVILGQAPPLMQARQGLLIDPARFSLSEINSGPLLATALRTSRGQFGIFLVGKGDKTSYSLSEHVRFCLLANHLTQALESAILYTDALDRNREIALIYQTGQRITQLQGLSQLMPRLVEAINETFGYESITILLNDPETRELVVKQTYGLRKERHLGFRLPITDAPEGGIVGWVAYHGKPYLAPDVHRVGRYVKTVEETRSELAVPLKIKGRVIGVLDVQSKVVGGVTEEDRYILEALADQVAIALENARLYGELASAHTEVQTTARQLQRLLERTVRIQEQERQRIAADIHDNVNQLLYAALYEAQAALQLLPSRSLAVTENLNNIQTSLERAMSEIRKAIFDLWPTSLDELGLIPSVQSYLTKFEKTSGIICKLKIKGSPFTFEPLARINIYRIVQEALHNVQKHAKASTIEVSFDFTSPETLISIGDDGVGLKWEELFQEADQHLGLISMRERARSIRGELSVTSNSDEGTLLTFTFPREAVEDEPADQLQRQDLMTELISVVHQL